MNGMTASGMDAGNTVQKDGSNVTDMTGMLVLGVNVGEYVQIGEDIKVSVTKHKNDNLRLIITAPKSVKILRSGVIEKDRKAAAAAATVRAPTQVPTAAAE